MKQGFLQHLAAAFSLFGTCSRSEREKGPLSSWALCPHPIRLIACGQLMGMLWFPSVASHALGFLLWCSPCWEVNTRTAVLLPLPKLPFMLCCVLLPQKTLSMPEAELTTYQSISTVLWFLWAPHLSRCKRTASRSHTMGFPARPQ